MQIRSCAKFLLVSLVLATNAQAAQICTNVHAKLRLVAGSIVTNPETFSTNLVWKWIGGFVPYSFDSVDLNWVPSQPTFRPGEGAAISLSSTSGVALCFTQPVQAPRLPLTLFSGINVVCCQSNVPASYEDIVGAPPGEGTRLYKLKPSATSFYPLLDTYYTIYAFDHGAWSPSVPVVDATEAVIVVPLPSLLNPWIVGGKFHFYVEALPGSALPIERSDSLMPGSWHLWTNLNAVSGLTEVSDPAGISNSPRFYRVRVN